MFDQTKDKAIALRIGGRQAAEQIAELADEEAARWGRVVWEQLLSICRAHIDEETRNKREVEMSSVEAKRFGNEIVPFGEFRGRRVDEVPLDRLFWYAEQRFVDELRRYLRSRRITEEQPDASP